MKELVIEGFTIIYGTSARDNDFVSTELAEPDDFWYHAAGYAGSHVLVRNPDRLDALPEAVERLAAEVAVYHSKARQAKGKIEVHAARARQVTKPKKFPPGKVVLKGHRAIKIYPPKEPPTAL